MANTTKYESRRLQALQMLEDNSGTTQGQLVRLYMSEVDRHHHSNRKDAEPLLDDGEMYTLHYKMLSPASREKVEELFKRRGRVMRAAQEIEHIKLIIRSRMYLISTYFIKLGNIETMEAAINMALLAVPEPDRSERAAQIANRIDLVGCSQTVDDKGLLRISIDDILEDTDMLQSMEQARTDIYTMLSQFKGCYNALMDYIKESKLDKMLPVSLKMLGEYEAEMVNYGNGWNWEKYKMQPVNLQHSGLYSTPTLQGLYGFLPDYTTVEPEQGGYNYMYSTYFSED